MNNPISIFSEELWTEIYRRIYCNFSVTDHEELESMVIHTIGAYFPTIMIAREPKFYIMKLVTNCIRQQIKNENKNKFISLHDNIDASYDPFKELDDTEETLFGLQMIEKRFGLIFRRVIEDIIDGCTITESLKKHNLGDSRKRVKKMINLLIKFYKVGKK